jgi:glycosyltransferase involved in cell wall biosynthesis
MPAADVSVVVPTRGRPELVLRAVGSVIRQTHASLEVVVVVDGPDPPTEAALRSIRDPRLQVLVSPERGGGAAARNLGIDRATGGWIAFLDDDDEWLPDKVARQLDCIRSEPALEAICFCPVYRRSRSELTLQRSRPPAPGEHASEYLFVRRSLREQEGTIGTSTILAPSALVRRIRFDERLPRYQDADFVLRACAEGVQLVFCPEPLSIWQAPGAGGDSITSRHAGDWAFALEWIRERRGLVTPRAYAAFVLLRVAALAQRAGAWRTIPALWREAFRKGRPGILEVALFSLRWITPSGLRARLRRSLTALRPRTLA